MLLRAAIACGSPPGSSTCRHWGWPAIRQCVFVCAAQSEGEVRASGLPYLIARPFFITGPDRRESRPGERIAAKVTDKVLGLAGHLGATALRIVHFDVGSHARPGARRVRLRRADTELVVETEELRRRGALDPGIPPRPDGGAVDSRLLQR